MIANRKGFAKIEYKYIKTEYKNRSLHSKVLNQQIDLWMTTVRIVKFLTDKSDK